MNNIVKLTLSNETIVISKPGSYKVMNSFTFDPSVNIGILIEASDVKLCLNYKTLSGSAQSQQYCIMLASTVSNIKIQKGTINKFTKGIVFIDEMEQLQEIHSTNNIVELTDLELDFPIETNRSHQLTCKGSNWIGVDCKKCHRMKIKIKK